jgi:hypothetical protein
MDRCIEQTLSSPDSPGFSGKIPSH